MRERVLGRELDRERDRVGEREREREREWEMERGRESERERERERPRSGVRLMGERLSGLAKRDREDRNDDAILGDRVRRDGGGERDAGR